MPSTSVSDPVPVVTAPVVTGGGVVVPPPVVPEPAGAVIWVQGPLVPGSEYQLPAVFSCTILPPRVSSSLTFDVVVSTTPLTATCRPFDADCTRDQALPAASMIGLAEAVVIDVPSGLAAGGGGGGGGVVPVPGVLPAGAVVWDQGPCGPGSEYQLPAVFSCTILPPRVSSSLTFDVVVSTTPLTAICRPFDADCTSVHELPEASMIALPAAEVIEVPSGLVAGGGG